LAEKKGRLGVGKVGGAQEKENNSRSLPFQSRCAGKKEEKARASVRLGGGCDILMGVSRTAFRKSGPGERGEELKVGLMNDFQGNKRRRSQQQLRGRGERGESNKND